MPLITTLVGVVLDGRRMVGTMLVANVDRRALVLMEVRMIRYDSFASSPIELNQFFQWLIFLLRLLGDR